MVKFSIIISVDANLGIGSQSDLPWAIRGEERRFKHITKYGVPFASEEYKKHDKYVRNKKMRTVILGANTYELYGARPFFGRNTIVITSNPSKYSEVITANCLENALEQAEEIGSYENFVVGGSTLFRLEAFSEYMRPNVEKIFVSHISGDFHCDSVIHRDWLEGFRADPETFNRTATEDGIMVTQQTWVKE